MSDVLEGKKSASVIDPELVPLLDRLPNLLIRSDEELKMFRQLLSTWKQPIPEDIPVIFEETTVPGTDGIPDIRVLVFQPKKAAGSKPCYLHFHGGGWAIGSAEVNNISNATISAELSCTVISVDYPKAPEYPYPMPMKAAYRVLQWIHENAVELGVDTDRIAVGGESAGANISAGLAQLVRDKGEYKLIFQRLRQPALDDRIALRGPHPYNGEFVLTFEGMTGFWRYYLGVEPGSDDVEPYAAPARAESLAGLPNAFISVGSIDLLADDALDYAKRLMHDGVRVELHLLPGMTHAAAPVVRVMQAEEKASMDALRRAFYG